MNIRSAQSWLFGVLAIALIVALFLLSWGYAERQFFEDEFLKLTVTTIGMFAGPVSIVSASFFAMRSHRYTICSVETFALSLVCTVLWSALTAGRVAYFVFSPTEEISVLVAWNAQVVSAASFLVDGVLAYFFVVEGITEKA